MPVAPRDVGENGASALLLIRIVGVAERETADAREDRSVCTPRDAVRVFYGTGLDMAALGNFVLRK